MQADVCNIKRASPMGAALSGGAGIVTPHPNTILCRYINNTVYTYTLLLLQHYIYKLTIK